jgi:hypothetical protein
MSDILLMAPGPGKCPKCAAAHGRDSPHEARSLYYRMRFRQAHGRFPDLWDSVQDCPEDTIEAWRQILGIPENKNDERRRNDGACDQR